MGIHHKKIIRSKIIINNYEKIESSSKKRKPSPRKSKFNQVETDVDESITNSTKTSKGNDELPINEISNITNINNTVKRFQYSEEDLEL